MKTQNNHIEHLDEIILVENGISEAINYLKAMRNILAGIHNEEFTATIKYDGAPSIFIGNDPADNRFFVAKKSIFNKNPKLYKSTEEIYNDIESGSLCNKLVIAFEECSKLGITEGIYQGDLMFTGDDIESHFIEGEVYTVFHPNTIAYGVNNKSNLCRDIIYASVGIIFHTMYVGDSIQNMKAVYGKPITEKFNKHDGIWFADASLSKIDKVSHNDISQFDILLNSIIKLESKINKEVLSDIYNNDLFITLIKKYNNLNIRNGGVLCDEDYINNMFHYINNYVLKEIRQKKSNAGKTRWEEMLYEIRKLFIDEPYKNLQIIFIIVNHIINCKKIILKNLSNSSGLETFILVGDELKRTSHEGLVLSTNDSVVKVVDRMEFSHNNFSDNVTKGFER